MFQIEHALPEQWRGLFHAATMPLGWLFFLQREMLRAAMSSAVPGLEPLQRLFLLLPVLGAIIGLWCTLLGAYSLIFRGQRMQFIGALLVLWWDVARCSWLFWAGMARFVYVLTGSVWGAVRLIVEAVIELLINIVQLPFVLTGSITKTLRQPGVPWLAFLLTLFWSALEAVIFAYILSPTVSEIVSDLTGSDTHRFLQLFLFLMLLGLISGSLACMHVLVDAIKRWDIPQIVQMVIVEFFVMFVEVLFFYRELIEGLTPWIMQQTGAQLGLVSIVVLASFGWLGVRGMVWFLFARFGTPTLLAIISRQRLPEEQTQEVSAVVSEQRWDRVLAKLKNEQNWFEQRAQALLEAAVLPSFQLIAASLNFAIVLFLSEPLFNLPFKNLAEVEETKALLQRMTAAAKGPSR